MSTASRDSVARLLVRVFTNQQPQLLRHCPRCAAERRFVSSGKFRVNAQRKSIDAWLIFLCTDCHYRWNLPIHERRAVRSMDPAELEALMRNDAALAKHHAAIVATTSAAVEVSLVFAVPVTEETATLEMTISVTASIRLDRLLAQVLGLRRDEIQDLCDGSVLLIAPVSRKALRRAAVDRMAARLDLAGCSEQIAARCRQRLMEGGFNTPAPDRPG